MIILHSLTLECPTCHRRERFEDTDDLERIVLSKRGKYKCPSICNSYMNISEVDPLTEDETEEMKECEAENEDY